MARTHRIPSILLYDMRACANRLCYGNSRLIMHSRLQIGFSAIKIDFRTSGFADGLRLASAGFAYGLASGQRYLTGRVSHSRSHARYRNGRWVLEALPSIEKTIAEILKSPYWKKMVKLGRPAMRICTSQRSRIKRRMKFRRSWKTPSNQLQRWIFLNRKGLAEVIEMKIKTLKLKFLEIKKSLQSDANHWISLKVKRSSSSTGAIVNRLQSANMHKRLI